MTSNIISTKVADEVTCELDRSSSNLNQLNATAETYSDYKESYSDSADQKLLPSKKFIIIPSTSTGSTEIIKTSLDVPTSKILIKKNKSDVSLSNIYSRAAFKEGLLNNELKPNSQIKLKTGGNSFSSMKSIVSGNHF